MIRPMPRVTAVRVVRDRVLHLTFDDGVAGEVDLAETLDAPIFEPFMSDDAKFAEVYVDESDTVNWPPGEFDLAPEVLHDEIASRQSPHDGSPVTGPST